MGYQDSGGSKGDVVYQDRKDSLQRNYTQKILSPQEIISIGWSAEGAPSYHPEKLPYVQSL